MFLLGKGNYLHKKNFLLQSSPGSFNKLGLAHSKKSGNQVATFYFGRPAVGKSCKTRINSSKRRWTEDDNLSEEGMKRILSSVQITEGKHLNHGVSQFIKKKLDDFWGRPIGIRENSTLCANSGLNIPEGKAEEGAMR